MSSSAIEIELIDAELLLVIAECGESSGSEVNEHVRDR